MSRDVHKKFPRIVLKKNTKRRDSELSTTPDLSGDDGYSAVEDVSDSEEEDEDGVVAAEEEHIITEQRKSGTARRLPQPAQDSDEDDEEDDDDADADEENEDDDDVDIGLNDDSSELSELSSSSWNGFNSDTPHASATHNGANPPATPARRQVRFAGIPDADSDSDDTTSDATDDGRDMFPDLLFMDHLDPGVRREIEYDRDDDESSNDSFWHFYETYDRNNADSSEPIGMNVFSSDNETVTPFASQPPTAASTPGPSASDSDVIDSEGYDSDGETTEEDVPAPPVVRKKQPRRLERAGASSDSDTDRPRQSRKGRPRLERFDLDSTDVKPVAVYDPVKRKMIIFTPQKSRDFGLSPESFRGLQFYQSTGPSQSSPIRSHSGSLMMGAMITPNTLADFMQSQLGPVEAFFPQMSGGMFGEDSESSGIIDDESDGERNLKIEDFIEFEDASSDDDAPTPIPETPYSEEDNVTDGFSTPGRRLSTAMSSSSANEVQAELHPLLSHFDNNANAVSAFRRDQINQQLVLGGAATSEALAFSSPYSLGTLKGIKNGSLQAVTAPITPERRQKRPSVSFGSELTQSPLDLISQKRKASSGIQEGYHKRHRSISDVRDMAL